MTSGKAGRCFYTEIGVHVLATSYKTTFISITKNAPHTLFKSCKFICFATICLICSILICSIKDVLVCDGFIDVDFLISGNPGDYVPRTKDNFSYKAFVRTMGIWHH